jgi:hypothetical protein
MADVPDLRPSPARVDGLMRAKKTRTDAGARKSACATGHRARISRLFARPAQRSSEERARLDTNVRRALRSGVVAWSVGDAVVGALAVTRPAIIRRLFKSSQPDAFLARWGVQVLGVATVQLLASLRPTRTTLATLATIRAAAVPGDLLAGVDGQPTPGLLYVGTLLNVGTAVIAWRLAARRRPKT